MCLWKRREQLQACVLVMFCLDSSLTSVFSYQFVGSLGFFGCFATYINKLRK